MLALITIAIWSLLTALAVAVSTGRVDWRDQIERLGNGDAEALAQIRRLVTAQLIRLGAFKAQDSWDDVAQEVIMRVWRSHCDGQIRDYRAFTSFVRTLTRNVMVGASRRRREEFSSDTLEEAPDLSSLDGALGPGEQLALRNALEQLSDRHREVVELIYLEGLSYDEAAESLQRPRGTINRLQREAMQQLREILLPPDFLTERPI